MISLNREFHRCIALFAVRRLAPQCENCGLPVARIGGRVTVEDGPSGLPHQGDAHAHERHARFHVALLAGSPLRLAHPPELVVNGTDQRAGRLCPRHGNRLVLHNTCLGTRNCGYLPARSAVAATEAGLSKGETQFARGDAAADRPTPRTVARPSRPDSRPLRPAAPPDRRGGGARGLRCCRWTGRPAQPESAARSRPGSPCRC